jgi:hypothetical protein
MESAVLAGALVELAADEFVADVVEGESLALEQGEIGEFPEQERDVDLRGAFEERVHAGWVFLW